MIASAIVWTSHFAVAGIVFTAVAECKTVSFVGAQEVFGGSLHEGHKGFVSGIEQLTVDRLEVSHSRKVLLQGDSSTDL